MVRFFWPTLYSSDKCYTFVYNMGGSFFVWDLSHPSIWYNENIIIIIIISISSI